MAALRCIIFDLDGTLTQTNRLIFDSFNYIARKYQGREYSEQEITAMFGPPEEGALLHIVGEEHLATALTEYLEFYRAHHHELASLYPGIVNLLEFLKSRGCLTALYTGKGIHTTMVTLEEFGLTRYFDSIVTGNDVVHHKPSAEGIQKIMKQFNLKPDEVLMVGDSVADVKASHAAGINVAAVLWDSYAKEKVLQMETDYTFYTVDAFAHWLKEQFNDRARS
jgi:HAD superfamily hydrolase (TIGR01509 family)